MAYILPLTLLMNYLDYIIVYFACGSPFATYYFLDYGQIRKYVWFESFLILVLWIPYALILLHHKVTELLNDDSEKTKILELNTLFRNFENHLPPNNSSLSLFELREVVERYSELTLITAASPGKTSVQGAEIYRITNNSYTQISSNCLNRRNRRKLLSHQIQAREDFLQVLEILSEFTDDIENLSTSAIEFAKLIRDEDGLILINSLVQILKQTHVRNVEKEILWKSIKPKQSNVQPNLVSLQVMTATINPRKKD